MPTDNPPLPLNPSVLGPCPREVDKENHLRLLSCFEESWPQVAIVRLYWFDFGATEQHYDVTMDQFRAMIENATSMWIGETPYYSPDSPKTKLWQRDVDADQIPVNFHAIPDCESLKPSPASPAYAYCYCYWVDDYPKGPDGPNPCQELEVRGIAVSSLCPRGRLRLAEMAALDISLKLLVGIEFDFAVIRPNHKHLPTHGPDSKALYEPGSEPWKVNYSDVEELLERMGKRLEDHKIWIRNWDPVGRGGRINLKLDPRPPRVACDVFVFARDSIHAMCEAEGWDLTLLTHPEKLSDIFKLHISLHHEDDPFHIAYTDGCKNEHFLAGMLEHLPALVALGKSTPMSYIRSDWTKPYKGQYASWGTGNKDATIRGVEPHHWEFSPVDALCPLPLVCAGLIHAGLDGVKQEKRPKYQDTRCTLTFQHSPPSSFLDMANS